MNVRQAAQRLNLSPQQVRWLIRGGRARAKKIKTRHNSTATNMRLTPGASPATAAPITDQGQSPP